MSMAKLVRHILVVCTLSALSVFALAQGAAPLMASAELRADGGGSDSAAVARPVRLDGDATSVAPVPRLVKYSGTLAGVSAGEHAVSFAFYTESSSDKPMWVETQTVTVDESGRYSVTLGASSPTGLPEELFANGSARWLGVHTESNTEAARQLLVSVPYALKAEDAQKLNGHTATEFILSADLQKAVEAAVTRSAGNLTVRNPIDRGLTGKGTGSVTSTSGVNTFSDTNTTQVVVVTQSGTGMALQATSTGTYAIQASAPGTGGNAAIYGTATGAGSSVAVQGDSAGATGIGLFGRATSATGANFGVRGESASDSGTGVVGVVTSPATTGIPVGVSGSVTSSSGVGVKGQATGPAGGIGIVGIANAGTGNSVGVHGEVSSPTGTAGEFVSNNANGNIIVGKGNGGAQQFVVTGQGNVTANGTVTAPNFSGSGAALTNLSGANVTGTVANATNAVNATNAASAAGLATGTYANAYTFNNAGNNFSGTFTGTHSGNGAALTNLTGANVTGIVANANNAAQLNGIPAASYARQDITNTFAASNFFTSNIVIGTSSPATPPLHVQGVNATTNTSNVATSYGMANFSNGTDTTLAIRSLGSGHIQFATDFAGRFLSFATGLFQERMRIDATGNVGIGTTTPSQKLDVTGNANITGNLTVGGTFTASDASKLGGIAASNYARLDVANNITNMMTVSTSAFSTVQPSVATPPPAAIQGIATASGSGVYAAGVLGVSNSPDGLGVVGVVNSNGTATQAGNGVTGIATCIKCTGVEASSQNLTGDGVGLHAEVASPIGTAIVAESLNGGDLIGGYNNTFQQVFRVDAMGTVTAGTLQGVSNNPFQSPDFIRFFDTTSTNSSVITNLFIKAHDSSDPNGNNSNNLSGRVQIQSGSTTVCNTPGTCGTYAAVIQGGNGARSKGGAVGIFAGTTGGEAPASTTTTNGGTWGNRANANVSGGNVLTIGTTAAYSNSTFNPFPSGFNNVAGGANITAQGAASPGDTSANAAGGNLTLNAGSGDGTTSNTPNFLTSGGGNNGGNVNVNGGVAWGTGNGGTVNINAGNEGLLAQPVANGGCAGCAPGGSGGNINMNAGQGGTNAGAGGGTVNINAGRANGGAGTGGNVNITSGQNATGGGNPGNVNISAASALATTGKNGGSIFLTPGSGDTPGVAGNVQVNGNLNVSGNILGTFTGSVANATNATQLNGVNGINYARLDVPNNFVANQTITTNYNGGITGQLHLQSSGSEAGISLEKTAFGTHRWSIKSGDNSVGSSNFGINDETVGLRRFSIDTAGNVGIGTTTPVSQLHVNSAGDTAIGISGGGTSNAAGINLYRPGTGTATNFDFTIYGSTFPGTNFGMSQANTAQITTNAGAPDLVRFDIGSRGSVPLVFGTNNAERMRITATGQVGVHNNNPFRDLDVAGIASVVDFGGSQGEAFLAIEGASSATAPTVSPLNLPKAGITGWNNSGTPANYAAGVIGRIDAGGGYGVFGVATFNGVSGNGANGVGGFTLDPIGVGVHGQNFAITGAGIGVKATVNSPNAVPLYVQTKATSPTADLIQGMNNNAMVFRVDANGNMTVNSCNGCGGGGGGAGLNANIFNGPQTINVTAGNALNIMNAGANVFNVDANGNAAATSLYRASGNAFQTTDFIKFFENTYVPGPPVVPTLWIQAHDSSDAAGFGGNNIAGKLLLKGGSFTGNCNTAGFCFAPAIEINAGNGSHSKGGNVFVNAGNTAGDTPAGGTNIGGTVGTVGSRSSVIINGGGVVTTPTANNAGPGTVIAQGAKSPGNNSINVPGGSVQLFGGDGDGTAPAGGIQLFAGFGGALNAVDGGIIPSSTGLGNGGSIQISAGDAGTLAGSCTPPSTGVAGTCNGGNVTIGAGSASNTGYAGSVNIFGGNAAVGSNGFGGTIFLQPGTGDGLGGTGVVHVNGDMSVVGVLNVTSCIGCGGGGGSAFTTPVTVTSGSNVITLSNSGLQQGNQGQDLNIGVTASALGAPGGNVNITAGDGNSSAETAGGIINLTPGLGKNGPNSNGRVIVHGDINVVGTGQYLLNGVPFSGGSGASLSASNTFTNFNTFQSNVNISTPSVASSGNPSINSPELHFEASYWNGASAETQRFAWMAQASTIGVLHPPKMVMMYGEPPAASMPTGFSVDANGFMTAKSAALNGNSLGSGNSLLNIQDFGSGTALKVYASGQYLAEFNADCAYSSLNNNGLWTMSANCGTDILSLQSNRTEVVKVDSNGNITLVNNSQALNAGKLGVSESGIKMADDYSSQDLNINGSTLTNNSSAYAGSVNIFAGDHNGPNTGAGAGNGGSMYVGGGSTNKGNGGIFEIDGGMGSATDPTKFGGGVYIYSGYGYNSGNIHLYPQNRGNAGGMEGQVVVHGDVNIVDGGQLLINGAPLSGGGGFSLVPAADSGTSVQISGADAMSLSSTTGGVNINGGDSKGSSNSVGGSVNITAGNGNSNSESAGGSINLNPGIGGLGSSNSGRVNVNGDLNFTGQIFQNGNPLSFGGSFDPSINNNFTHGQTINATDGGVMLQLLGNGHSVEVDPIGNIFTDAAVKVTNGPSNFMELHYNGVFATGNAQDLNLSAGIDTTFSHGGRVYINGGNSDGDGGSLNLNGGHSTNDGDGGSINLTPGVGSNGPSSNGRVNVTGDLNFTGQLLQNGSPLSFGGASQWTTTGSDIGYTTGNVGIGTNNPLVPLHVKTTNATTNAELEADSGQISQLQLVSGTKEWQLSNRGNSNSEFELIYYDGSTFSFPMTVLTNGNVGIGTTTPGALLDVNGNVNISGNLNVTSCTGCGGGGGGLSASVDNNFTAGQTINIAGGNILTGKMSGTDVFNVDSTGKVEGVSFHSSPVTMDSTGLYATGNASQSNDSITFFDNTPSPGAPTLWIRAHDSSDPTGVIPAGRVQIQSGSTTACNTPGQCPAFSTEITAGNGARSKGGNVFINAGTTASDAVDFGTIKTRANVFINAGGIDTAPLDVLGFAEGSGASIFMQGAKPFGLNSPNISGGGLSIDGGSGGGTKAAGSVSITGGINYGSGAAGSASIQGGIPDASASNQIGGDVHVLGGDTNSVVPGTGGNVDIRGGINTGTGGGTMGTVTITGSNNFINGPTTFNTPITFSAGQTFPGGGSSQWTTSGSNIYNSNSGNVGIGTTTPSELLDVRSSTAMVSISSVSTLSTGFSQLVAGANNGTASTVHQTVYNASATGSEFGFNRANAALWYADGSNLSNFGIGTINAIPLTFGTNDIARMTITGAGNVGIGTTSPATKLEVLGAVQSSIVGGGKVAMSAGSSTTDSQVVASNDVNNYISMETEGSAETGNFLGVTAANLSDIYSRFSSALAIGTYDAKPLIFSTNNSERARFDAAGNFGIGTTTPQTKLELVGDTATFIMRAPTASSYGSFRIYNDQNTSLRALEMGYTGTTYSFSALGGGIAGETAYLTSTGAYPLQFGTANTFRAIITSAGNFGIGTTTPGALLDVNGNANVSGSLTVGTGGTQIKNHFSGSVAISTAFSSLTSLINPGCLTSSVTLNGVALGDVVSLGPDPSLMTSISPNQDVLLSGWVSAANTVTLRVCRFTSGGTPSGVTGNIEIDVLRH